MKSTYARNRKSLVDLSGQGAAGGFIPDDNTTHQKALPKDDTINEEMESMYNFTDLGDGLQSGGQANAIFNSQVSGIPIPVKDRRKS
jgi:hypothetical protein